MSGTQLSPIHPTWSRDAKLARRRDDRGAAFWRLPFFFARRWRTSVSSQPGRDAGRSLDVQVHSTSSAERRAAQVFVVSLAWTRPKRNDCQASHAPLPLVHHYRLFSCYLKHLADRYSPSASPIVCPGGNGFHAIAASRLSKTVRGAAKILMEEHGCEPRT